MALPRRKIESGNDDLQTVDLDVSSLTAKFLTPIDNIRSFSRPGPATSGDVGDFFRGSEQNSIRPLESRAHAFLRYVGFPVAVSDGFYNPGFDPTGTQFLGEISGENQKKRTINAKFNQSPFRQVVEDREFIPRENRAIFSRKDINSSVYALILTSISDIRPFQVLTEGQGPFEPDPQTFSILSRLETVNQFTKENPNYSDSDLTELAGLLGVDYTEGRHVLKPFVVDPKIDATVMPAQSRVAVPFLPDAQSLRLEENKSVLRPGLELIIRERLRSASNVDLAFIETAKLIADNASGSLVLDIPQGTAIDVRSAKNALEAILDDNQIDISDIQTLEGEGLSTVQTKNITQLVKLLKGVIKILSDSVDVINFAREKINWVPLPNADGPELGARGAQLNNTLISSGRSKIDKNIANLEQRKYRINTRLTEDVDLGDFASPFSVTTNTEDVSKVSEQLREFKSLRNRIATQAFEAMGNIELIVGEASGLGLIDVLSVYIALWSMDEAALIGMLDEASFSRLVNNFGDLVSGAAADRRDSGEVLSIEESLQIFEDKLRNVLTFADRELARQRLSPDEEEGGEVSSDQ